MSEDRAHFDEVMGLVDKISEVCDGYEVAVVMSALNVMAARILSGQDPEQDEEMLDTLRRQVANGMALYRKHEGTTQ